MHVHVPLICISLKPVILLILLLFSVFASYFINDKIFLMFRAADGPENINLTRSPYQEYNDKGSDINLDCSVDSGPVPAFNWFLNGGLLSDAGSKLRLVNIQKGHSGNYICQALNSRSQRNHTSQAGTITVLTCMFNQILLTQMVLFDK